MQLDSSCPEKLRQIVTEKSLLDKSTDIQVSVLRHSLYPAAKMHRLRFSETHEPFSTYTH